MRVEGDSIPSRSTGGGASTWALVTTFEHPQFCFGPQQAVEVFRTDTCTAFHDPADGTVYHTRLSCSSGGGEIVGEVYGEHDVDCSGQPIRQLTPLTSGQCAGNRMGYCLDSRTFEAFLTSLTRKTLYVTYGGADGIAAQSNALMTLQYAFYQDRDVWNAIEDMPQGKALSPTALELQQLGGSAPDEDVQSAGHVVTGFDSAKLNWYSEKRGEGEIVGSVKIAHSVFPDPSGQWNTVRYLVSNWPAYLPLREEDAT